MLLTIKETGANAPTLSWLLHKHPGKAQTFDLKHGKAHVFYPENDAESVQVALLLDIDPVELVRGRDKFTVAGHPLSQYVNDRPYAASSLLSVALNKVFGSAINGKCEGMREAVDVVRNLETQVSVASCHGGEDLLKRLFEPLGYTVETESMPLDTEFPEWGRSPYYDLTLKGSATLKDHLSHLYVLFPVLDNDKHYWVGEEEVEKLLRRGESWLDAHPEKELIMRRYLKNRGNLVNMALQNLAEEEDPEAAYEAGEAAEMAVEKPISLHTRRLEAVHRALKNSGSRTVIDMGCGEGKLIKLL
ncbi:MAG: 3' terminal RNA ribose 2'-O-methyltransferase Hen1, partial [Bacteroidota bacterium]